MAGKRSNSSEHRSPKRRRFPKKEDERLSGEKLPKREVMSAVRLLGGPFDDRHLPPA